MFGLLAMARTHPHVVAPDTLYLRSGAFTEIRVPRALVDDVRLHRRYYTLSDRLQVDGGAASVVAGGQTQIDIRLNAPLDVAGTEVTEIRIAADRPGAFVSAARSARSPSPA